MGPADRRGRRFREADMADLARVNQLAQRFDRVLDGRAGVNAVLVVQVDVVGTEPTQRSLYSHADVLRRAVASWLVSVAVADQPELGRQHHLVASPADRPPCEFLGAVGSINLDGVADPHAEIEGGVDPSDWLGFSVTSARVLV